MQQTAPFVVVGKVLQGRDCWHSRGQPLHCFGRAVGVVLSSRCFVFLYVVSVVEGGLMIIVSCYGDGEIGLVLSALCLVRGWLWLLIGCGCGCGCGC